MLKVLAPGWERTFSRRIPSVLNGLASNAGYLLEEFHRDVEARAMRNGISQASIQMLKHQLPTYKIVFKDLSSSSQNDINNQQKEINRAFVPVIADAMAAAYEDCAAEVGRGQYMRMKAIMTRHVHEAQHTMFLESTSTVTKQIKTLLKNIENTMLTKADDVFLSIKRDYTSVVVGKQGQTARDLPRAQRTMRQDVLKTVEGSETVFKRVVGAEHENEAEAFGEDHEGEAQDPKEEPQNEEDEDTARVKQEAYVNREDDRAIPKAVHGRAPKSLHGTRSESYESNGPESDAGDHTENALENVNSDEDDDGDMSD